MILALPPVRLASSQQTAATHDLFRQMGMIAARGRFSSVTSSWRIACGSEDLLPRTEQHEYHRLRCTRATGNIQLHARYLHREEADNETRHARRILVFARHRTPLARERRELCNQPFPFLQPTGASRRIGNLESVFHRNQIERCPDVIKISSFALAIIIIIIIIYS